MRKPSDAERALLQHYAQARARLRNRPPGPAAAAKAPKTEPPPPAPLQPLCDEALNALCAQPVTCRFVIAHVGAYYGVSMIDLLSARRMTCIVWPRWVAIHLARTLTLKTLGEIGRQFGGRQQAAVHHALRRIAGEMSVNARLAQDVAELTRRIIAREAPRAAFNNDQVPFV